MGSLTLIKQPEPESAQSYQLRRFNFGPSPLAPLEPGIKKLDQVLADLKRQGTDTVALKAHSYPDLDAVSSMLGFKTISEKLGIHCILCVGQDYISDTSTIRNRLIASWWKIRALPIDLVPKEIPSILFDTSEWQRAELPHAPLAIFDNHGDKSLGNFSAVATLVAAHLLSRAELGAQFWKSKEGRELAAILMLGIATDCQYVPLGRGGVLNITRQLPGMQNSDWGVFQSLRPLADRKLISGFNYAPFWLALRQQVTEAQAMARNLGGENNQLLVYHLGEINPRDDDIRSIVADSLLADPQGSPNPSVRAVVVTSQNNNSLKISARWQNQDGNSDSGEANLRRLMQDCCGADQFGVRNTVAGGRIILNSSDDSTSSIKNRLEENITRVARFF